MSTPSVLMTPPSRITAPPPHKNGEESLSSCSAVGHELHAAEGEQQRYRAEAGCQPEPDPCGAHSEREREERTEGQAHDPPADKPDDHRNGRVVQSAQDAEADELQSVRDDEDGTDREQPEADLDDMRVGRIGNVDEYREKKRADRRRA